MLKKMLKVMLVMAPMLLCSCQAVSLQPSKKQDHGGTLQGKILVLKNVPLPQDFFIVGGSFWHGTQSFRYGEVLLQGEMTVDDVFLFFKKQMPENNWKVLQLNAEESKVKLEYENKDELCTILCREDEQMSKLKIVIEQKKS